MEKERNQEKERATEARQILEKAVVLAAQLAGDDRVLLPYNQVTVETTVGATMAVVKFFQVESLIRVVPVPWQATTSFGDTFQARGKVHRQSNGTATPR